VKRASACFTLSHWASRSAINFLTAPAVCFADVSSSAWNYASANVARAKAPLRLHSSLALCLIWPAPGEVLPGHSLMSYPPKRHAPETMPAELEPADDLARTAQQVKAAKDGNSTAMDSLFARYLPQVRGIVAARMGRRLHAFVELEDMVQESMRLAIAGLERFEHRTEGAFRHWLAKCVENAIRKEVRSQGASKRGHGKVQRVADFATTRLAESLFPDGGPGVSKAARDREEEERVEAAMLDLSPRYREVIALRVHGEMSYREIAAAMELPSENTANALFLRARQKLARILQDSEAG